MIYILASVLIFSLHELVPSLISHNVILSFVLQFMAVLQHTVSSDTPSVLVLTRLAWFFVLSQSHFMVANQTIVNA